ncbi:hypothetical protein [Geoglobus acetivorans]|uniref:Uncharacterized protein n=1 Tax=Geoglobus acetivorans TaxID=565033 RepID=A0A0A7GJS2_GEOAI|nr:hypothetical protein GACE_2160 [Geoglobus acetivorans]
MGCVECKFYEYDGRYSCRWFEARISRIFPRWADDFRKGELRFKKCGYFRSKK